MFRKYLQIKKDRWRHRSFLLTFLNDFKLKEIKFDLLNKTVLTKSYLRVTLKLLNVGVKPDWNTKIQFIADGFQSLEDFVSSGILGFLFIDGIL